MIFQPDGRVEGKFVCVEMVWAGPLGGALPEGRRLCWQGCYSVYDSGACSIYNCTDLPEEDADFDDTGLEWKQPWSLLQFPVDFCHLAREFVGEGDETKRLDNIKKIITSFHGTAS